MNKMVVKALSLSAAGLISIAGYESFRSVAYQDSGGIYTVGYGTTAGVKPGHTITPEQALKTLGLTVAEFEAEIKKCLGDDLELYQHEWDAFVSLAYNIGPGAFCKSSIVTKLHMKPRPDYVGACESIKLYVKAGGRVLPGLVKRRQQEYETCMGR